MDDRRGAPVDLEAIREEWRTKPTDLAGWAMRAERTLRLAEMWRENALEWEQLARKPSS